MSEPIIKTYQVVVERDVTDLEQCLLILRNIAKNYPRHFDIALEALRAEYRLPPDQTAIRKEEQS